MFWKTRFVLHEICIEVLWVNFVMHLEKADIKKARKFKKRHCIVTDLERRMKEKSEKVLQID